VGWGPASGCTLGCSPEFNLFWSLSQKVHKYERGQQDSGFVELNRQHPWRLGFANNVQCIDGKAEQFEQVGLVRVITDGVTFGYLTDVYILPDHQGGGHGRWMLEILNEVLQSWPHLRRVMLLTTDKMHLFGKNLGMKDYREFDGMKGVSIAMVEGPGAQH
jgi:GNAT superfamily N-acetyltransferase